MHAHVNLQHALPLLLRMCCSPSFFSFGTLGAFSFFSFLGLSSTATSASCSATFSAVAACECQERRQAGHHRLICRFQASGPSQAVVPTYYCSTAAISHPPLCLLPLRRQSTPRAEPGAASEMSLFDAIVKKQI
jgi:hypothetical protein